MSEWWLGIATTIVGGTIAILSAWLSDKRRYTRERSLRLEDFQRDTMFALQDASQELLRAAGRMHYLDIVAFRNTGVWQKQKLPEDLDELFRQKIVTTKLLASRILDEKTRSLENRLREEVVAISLSENERLAEARMMNASNTLSEIIDHIGECTRELSRN